MSGYTIDLLYGAMTALLGAAGAGGLCWLHFRYHDNRQGTAKARHATEVLVRLCDLTTRVAIDVREHNNQVEEISGKLTSTQGAQPQSIRDAVSKLVEANQQIQERLDLHRGQASQTSRTDPDQRHRGPHRSAHLAGQSPPAGQRAGPAPGRAPPSRPHLFALDGRPRPLQGDQRRLRASRGRPGAPRGGHHAPPHDARHGPGRPLRRRRVCHHLAGHGRGATPARRRPASARTSRPPASTTAARPCGSPRAWAWSRRWPTKMPPPSSSAPTRPSMPPRQADATQSTGTTAKTPGPPARAPRLPLPPPRRRPPSRPHRRPPRR